MSERVLVSQDGKTGIITLNRPEAINALTPDMIAAIAAAFDRFSADDGVAAILLEGVGKSGFCAGGDVRAVRKLMLDGAQEEAFAFFEAEYGLNGVIATSKKPVVALTDGVVMGGGIGLAGHAGFRFATDRARFAMPESAIGFFCDVGANAILAKAPLNRALAFLLTGLPVGAADALALGLTDCVIKADSLVHVRGELIAAIEEGDVRTSIVNMMQAHAIEAGTAHFVEEADRLDAVFTGDDAGEIVAALKAVRGDRAAEWREVLSGRCPASLVVIDLSQRAARRLSDIKDVLAMDLRLARLMAVRADFAEGVRALLVDKDKKPVWRPQHIADVDRAAIADAIG